jgi:hypothetical protein
MRVARFPFRFADQFGCRGAFECQAESGKKERRLLDRARRQEARRSQVKPLRWQAEGETVRTAVV